MNKTEIKALQNIFLDSFYKTKYPDIKQYIQSVLKQSADLTKSDLACFYKQDNFYSFSSPLKIKYKIGRYGVSKTRCFTKGFVEFVYECNEIVVLTEQKLSPFKEILLNENMNSGLCFPLTNDKFYLGIIVVNSICPFFYNKEKILLIESFFKIVQNTLRNLKVEDKSIY